MPEPTEVPNPPTPIAEPAKTDPAAPSVEEKSLIGEAKALVAEAKPAAEPVVPLTVADIKLPEGVTADDAITKEFIEILNKDMPVKDRAQALIGLQTKALTTASERGSQEFATLQTQWRDQIAKDPEIGGPKLEGNLANIAKVLDRFGTPEARLAFDVTGAGNNPHIVKMMANIAKAVTEPGPVPPGGNPPVKRDAAELLYPNQGKAA